MLLLLQLRLHLFLCCCCWGALVEPLGFELLSQEAQGPHRALPGVGRESTEGDEESTGPRCQMAEGLQVRPASTTGLLDHMVMDKRAVVLGSVGRAQYRNRGDGSATKFGVGC